MTNAEKINEFLDKAGVWFFLTTDGEQPKGRPFRFHLLQNDTLYFGTGTFKKVFAQMKVNPHVEILAVNDNEFLRYDGDVVFEETDKIANAVLEKAPQMKQVYNEQTGFKLGIFHLENGKAEICTMMGQKEAFEV
ncbi:MAG: pyridoxamine 5'-phosphate oxidase family protein [Clostridiales bacterium]|nr:pyridoxamine 5'-phosphate oxidase family protein [Clostridiales bacterium]